MSEPQTETPIEPETVEEAPASPQEPEPENPDAEPDEAIEGPGEEADEPEEPSEAEAVSHGVLTDKERKKRDDRLDNEKQRHASRLGEILGEEATSLIPCPVCMDGIDGWIFAPEVEQLSPEAISRIRQVIGLPDYSTFLDAPDAKTCPECDGRGEVKTGSHVPGYETKTCRLCSKTGWIGVGQAAQTNGHVEEPEQVVTGPTVYQADTEDPEIRHLRERGFTVIPPMQVQAG
jgi:hypothetical protein